LDGKLLKRELRHIINEESGSDLLDTFTTYNFLNDAANEINMRIEHIKNSQTLTIVANQTDYTLDARYMKLYQKALRTDKHFVQFSDGTTRHNIPEKDRDTIVHGNQAVTVTSVAIPDNFYISDDKILDDQVTSTTTSAGALSAGKATLTDTAADFSDVSPGDNLHNIDDGSIGIVISKTSSTVLITAMFDGVDDDWGSGDTYVIQPQGRYKLVFDPPPSTAGNTVEVPYISRLAPVYSDYDHFRLPIQYKEALLNYAAFLYNYRAGRQEVGDKFFVLYDNAVRRSAHNSNKALGRNRVVVSFKKRQVNS
jgi:hypothetical protein